jgi:tetratricopeptide (TPR) repeat protein
MRSQSKFFRFMVIAVVLLPLLSACEDTAMLDFLAEMAVEWAQEKGILTAENTVDWIQVGAYQLQRTLAGSTGDSELDAALEAGPVVHTLHQADKLSDEGLAEGDLGKIDQAISLRPDDWSYYDKKAAVLINQGNVIEAERSFEESEWLVDDRIQNGGDCKTLKLNLYRNREQALLSQLAGDEGNQDLLDALDESQSQIYYLQSNHERSPCP